MVSLTVPKKYNNNKTTKKPKLSNFVSKYLRRWNWKMLAWKSCWFDRCTSDGLRDSELVQMDWGIQSWKSQHWRWPVSVRNEQTAFCAETNWRRSTYCSYSWNNNVSFQLAQLTDFCPMILTCIEKRNRAKMAKPVPERPEKTTAGWTLKGLVQNVWTRRTKTHWRRRHRWWNLAVFLLHPSQTVQPGYGWPLTGISDVYVSTWLPESEATVFYVGVVVVFSTHRVQLWLTV